MVNQARKKGEFRRADMEKTRISSIGSENRQINRMWKNGEFCQSGSRIPFIEHIKIPMPTSSKIPEFQILRISNAKNCRKTQNHPLVMKKLYL